MTPADHLRSRVLGAATAVLAVALLGLVPDPAQADPLPPSSCAPPTRVGPVPPPTGTVHLGAAVPPAITTDLDMDDDGTADQLTVSGSTVTVVRGDGTLTITGFPDVPSVAAGLRAADLDGDGPTELFVGYGAVTTSAPGASTRVIPGTTTPGTVDFATAAWQFPGLVVGDVTGDGLDDAHVMGPRNGLPGFSTLQPHFSSLVGAPGPDLDAFIAGRATPSLGDRADVDGDGELDTVTMPYATPDGPRVTLRLTRSASTIDLATGAAEVTLASDRYSAFVRLRSPYFLTFDTTVWHRVPLTCARPWLGRVTQALVHRPPTTAELSAVGAEADPRLAARTAVVRALLLSREARAATVTDAYGDELDRAADPSGLAHWTTAVVQGRVRPEELHASLLASNEAYRKAGGTDRGWVEAAYHRHVTLTPDAAGVAYWTAKVATVGRARTARLFLATPGARRIRVQQLYKVTLGRPADPGGIAHGVGVLTRSGEDALRTELLASEELWFRSQRDPA